MYNYSQRLRWLSCPNPFSKLLTQQRQAGRKLLDLTISNPTEALSDYPHAQIGRACSLCDFTYRPDPYGEEQARLQIATWYAARGIVVSPAQLALTASTSEAYAILFKLLCNPGDEILVPAPSYPLFEYLARLESARPVPYRLAYDGSWFIDFASLTRAISPCTRALVIVNPNNPTGSFLKKHEAQKLFAIALDHRLPVISDEVFMEFPAGNQEEYVRTLIGSDEILSFSLNGLSKTAAMPQMKLAWIAINGPADERHESRSRLELLLDTYLSVGTPVQRALADLLELGELLREQLSRRINQNREKLLTLIKDSPVHTLHGEGGWSAILQVPNVLSEEQWITRLLLDRDVIVQPGYFFDMPSEAYLIASLITEPAIFAEGLRRIIDLANTI